MIRVNRPTVKEEEVLRLRVENFRNKLESIIPKYITLLEFKYALKERRSTPPSSKNFQKENEGIPLKCTRLWEISLKSLYILNKSKIS